MDHVFNKFEENIIIEKSTVKFVNVIGAFNGKRKKNDNLAINAISLRAMEN